jgi:hypothetical protein
MVKVKWHKGAIERQAFKKFTGKLNTRESLLFTLSCFLNFRLNSFNALLLRI